jgi:hypothetical protein
MNDQSVRDCIFKNVVSLTVLLEQLKKAVALFDLIERTDSPSDVLRNEYFEYRMIAARDGALAVFHFGCCLEAIKKQLPRSNSLSAVVEIVKIRDIATRFSALFPHVDHVRHGIAHAGQVFESPEKIKQTGMKVRRYGPGFAVDEGGYLLSALNDRTYSVGNRGEVFSITLDPTAISNLHSVLSSVQEAFQAAFKRTGSP